MSAIDSNFTPMPDDILAEHGMGATFVWGMIWRYCQMDKGYCNASYDRIAERCHMSRRGVIAHIKTLIKAGLIVDRTPDRRNAPHEFEVLGVQNLHSNNDGSAKSALLGVQNLHGDSAKSALLGVQNLHEKIHSKDTNKDITTDTKVSVGRTSPPPAILEKSIPEIKKLDCDIDTLRELHRLEGEKEKPRKSLMTYLDGRINPPPAAVEVYREITQRYPARALYDTIAETVGDDEASLVKWRQVVTNYLGNGWNPTNLNGMLEKFKGNWDGKNGTTHTRHENPPQNSKGGQKQNTRRNEPPLNQADIEQQRRLDAMFPRRR